MNALGQHRNVQLVTYDREIISASLAIDPRDFSKDSRSHRFSPRRKSPGPRGLFSAARSAAGLAPHRPDVFGNRSIVKLGIRTSPPIIAQRPVDTMQTVKVSPQFQVVYPEGDPRVVDAGFGLHRNRRRSFSRRYVNTARAILEDHLLRRCTLSAAVIVAGIVHDDLPCAAPDPAAIPPSGFDVRLPYPPRYGHSDGAMYVRRRQR